MGTRSQDIGHARSGLCNFRVCHLVERSRLEMELQSCALGLEVGLVYTLPLLPRQGCTSTLDLGMDVSTFRIL